MDLAGPSPELVLDDNNNTSNSSKYGDSQTSPFPNFTRLGEQIFYFDPRQSHSDAQSKPGSGPDLVILCPWLYARSRHIAKYSASYQEIYPSTPILLLKQDGPDMTWRPNSWQMDDLKAAISVIQKLESGQDAALRVLMHVFSNGGSFTACQLADAYSIYALSSQRSGHLPISGLVIDSAPSIPTMSTGYAAMSQGLPSSLPGPVRAAAGLALYTSFLAFSSVSKLMGSEGVITGMRRRLNDLEGAFMQGRSKRIYIYSQTDKMVPYQHVEKHAYEAKEFFNSLADGLGDELIRLERFEGSKHVAHVVVDPQRYWNIIKALWLEVG